MKMNGLKTLLASLLSLMLFIGSAHAAGLNAKDAKQFAESINDAVALAEELKESGSSDVFDDEDPFVEGEFKPYSAPLAKMKAEDPKAYKRVGAMAKKHGFKTAEAWAGAGDLTMLAYMALKLPPGIAQMAGALTPQMLSMMPEETRLQYEKSKKVMNALSAVSDEDKQVVAGISSLLDAALVSAGEQSGAFDAVGDVMGGMQ